MSHKNYPTKIKNSSKSVSKIELGTSTTVQNNVCINKSVLFIARLDYIAVLLDGFRVSLKMEYLEQLIRYSTIE